MQIVSWIRSCFRIREDLLTLDLYFIFRVSAWIPAQCLNASRVPEWVQVHRCFPRVREHFVHFWSIYNFKKILNAMKFVFCYILVPILCVSARIEKTDLDSPENISLWRNFRILLSRFNCEYKINYINASFSIKIIFLIFKFVKNKKNFVLSQHFWKRPFFCSWMLI